MSEDHEREIDEALERGEIPEADLRDARDAMVAYYLERGDTANAHRLRVANAIQDRMLRGGIGGADLDQLLVLFHETSDDLVVAQVIGLLISAEVRGLVPATYRDRIIEAGRVGLRSERWSIRKSSCALLSAMDARSERAAIMALLNDQDERVRERAAQVLASWDGPPNVSAEAKQP
jgi:hypothetical protein